ncbi:MAG: kinase inhibitor, partial [Betaproteobacteria bacterium PRO3]|nr:kinase inhibitor [Betaproteobacteria bacterium PRO3]
METSMHRLITTTAALALGGFALAAAAFTLSSAEIKPEATIANAQVFNGFGCTG